MNGVHVQHLDEKGRRGVIATAAVEEEYQLLVDVPAHLILSVDMAWAHATHDHHLREVLVANGEFAKVRLFEAGSLFSHVKVYRHPEGQF